MTAAAMAAAAAGAHLVLVGVVDLAGLGSVRWASPSLALLPAAAVAVVLVARSVDPTLPAPVVIGLAWFALGLLHHAAVGLAPRWDGEGLRGGAHVAWDVAFHLPPVVLGAAPPRPKAAR